MGPFERAIALTGGFCSAIFFPLMGMLALLAFDTAFRVALQVGTFVVPGCLVALVLTLRDLYLRRLPDRSTKILWVVLVLVTEGIGQVLYVYRYGLPPRSSSPTQPLPIPMTCKVLLGVIGAAWVALFVVMFGFGMQ